ncbi:MAG: PAS domain-containing protein, partial [Acidobacteriota bacterium]
MSAFATRVEAQDQMAAQEPEAQSLAAPDRSDGPRASAFGRSHAGARGGSVGMVLVVAVLLVGAAVGLVYVGSEHAQPYIMALLALLATVGVFSLFAIAAGILRFAGKDQDGPLFRALIDNASDGLLVTDQNSRVLYANGSYLDLIDASGPDDVRPIERVFIGDPDVSESIYRLLKAAREGRRLHEEVRISGGK